MKNYFKRLSDGCPKWRFVIWWIIRASLIFAFIKGFFPPDGKEFDITDPLQVGANFLCTFVWEIFMLFPEKSLLRHVPSSVQTFLMVGIWAGSFGGKFLNLYYDFRWWDVILHFVGGAACVFFGYEIACAILKSRKATAPISLVLLASFILFPCFCIFQEPKIRNHPGNKLLLFCHLFLILLFFQLLSFQSLLILFF